MNTSPDGILDASRLRLWKIEDGSLVLKYWKGSSERKALLGPPRRSLPLSDPEHWIIFADCDGTEIGVIRAIDDLDQASQAVLREALQAEYTLERILKVLEVEREPLSGQTRWRVEMASPDASEPAETSNRDGSSLSLAQQSTAQQSTAQQSTAQQSAVQAPLGALHSLNGSSAAEPSRGEAAGEAGVESEEERPRALEKVASLLSLGREKSVAEAEVSTVEREFTIAGQEDVQTARYPHIFIVDTERRRYEIADCEVLDAESRKAAERFF